MAKIKKTDAYYLNIARKIPRHEMENWLINNRQPNLTMDDPLGRYHFENMEPPSREEVIQMVKDWEKERKITDTVQRIAPKLSFAVMDEFADMQHTIGVDLGTSSDTTTISDYARTMTQIHDAQIKSSLLMDSKSKKEMIDILHEKGHYYICDFLLAISKERNIYVDSLIINILEEYMINYKYTGNPIIDKANDILESIVTTAKIGVVDDDTDLPF